MDHLQNTIVGHELVSDPFCVILPAAGFGTRMGTPESKEMLTAPDENAPLIQFALDLFYHCPGHIVVPTRAEKKNLISFIQTHYPQVIVQIIEPSQEWPDTVLQSKKYWMEKNILVLPDTRWAPTNAVFQVMKSLDHSACAFSTFSVSQLESWGVFCLQPHSVCDKPPRQEMHSDAFSYFSWGHIAFHQHVGEKIFSQILRSHRTRQFEQLDFEPSVSPIALDWFHDLTRGKS